jgi:type I restriction enzyme S subunit
MHPNWRKYRLGDLGRIVTGRTPPTSKPYYFGDKYPFITPSDMDGRKKADSTQRYLSEEGAKLLQRNLIPSGSVAVSCIGWQMGKSIMTCRPSFTNQQLNTIIPNEKVDADFLYYALSMRKDEFLSLGAATGVRTPILNKSAFSNLDLLIPQIGAQRKIAAILSAYDDLIENNTRRIAILEEMAQALYREWFVHFRFPGHEGVRIVESELGPVPEGWEVKPIGEVIETLGGGTPSKNRPEYWEGGDITWFIPSDLTSTGTMFISDSSNKINALGLKKSSARLFPPYSVMMTSRATIGVTAFNTKEACTNQGFITCVPNEQLPAFQVYFWIAENKEKIITVASGATFKEINKTTFRKLPIAIPDRHTHRRFVETVEPMCAQIENLIAKNGDGSRACDT